VADHDAIAKYDKTAKTYAASLAPKADADQLERFFGMLKPGDSVLDAGCAAGRDTKLIAEAGFLVAGVDLSEGLLKIARKTFPTLKFIQADIAHLPFDDKSFDGIWASAVLHHFPKSEMPQVAAEFARVLRGGGVLHIHTKLGEGTLSSKDNFVEGEERKFTLLTAPALKQIIEGAGFIETVQNVRESKSRPGLFWLNGYYRKA
jgi:ubiquinone/menaquinone biosynthesis C-methylase UbiE